MKYDSFLCETVFHMFYIYSTLWVFHYTVEHMGQSRGSKEKARWLFIHSKNVMKRGAYSLFMLKCFLIFFSIGPRVRLIITTTQIPCRTCQPPVNRSCWNIWCLFRVELIFSLQKYGRKIILMTKPIKTQNNSYATTDDTKMSPNQGGDSYYLSPLQSYSWHTLRNKRHVWSGSKDSFKMNSPIKHSFNGWFINKEEFCPVHWQCMASL